ncbi:hypothetical protein [Actinacidiphila polyblastidii]|uniref:hypothetical protein n=1 Tax=Actinacidiphila polyblastidii TaxID=3110430 RepID=UPI0039BD6BA6
MWANALHAVRLNQTAPAGGLQLGDTVVAYLSTVAPLALAGAVHLYILIARGPDNHADRTDQADRPGHHQGGQRSPGAGQAGAGQPVSTPTDPSRVTGELPTAPVRSLTGAGDPVGDGRPVTGHPGTRNQAHQAADLGGQPDSGPAVSDRPAATAPVSAHPVRHPPVTDLPVTPAPVSDREPRRAGDPRPDLDTQELLEIARSAVKAQDKLTRQVVAQAIRGQRIPLSSDTLTALMAQLREQRDEPLTTSRD